MLREDGPKVSHLPYSTLFYEHQLSLDTPHYGRNYFKQVDQFTCLHKSLVQSEPGLLLSILGKYF